MKEAIIENMGINRGLAILIIDKFEDLLAKNNIKIPDDEREFRADESCVYGATYYELEEEITELLNQFIKEE